MKNTPVLHWPSRSSHARELPPARMWAYRATAALAALLLLISLIPVQAAPLAVTPVASLNVPATTMIGEAFSFTVTFDNTGTGTEVGYGPYVDLFLPIGGVDGTSSGRTNDGISFGSATYLGAAVNSVILTCAPGGTLTHPLTELMVTCPAKPTGFDASFTWQFVNLELPFGSFAADQPPAAITVNANLSNYADLGVPLPIQAVAGFRYGKDPLDNPVHRPAHRGQPRHRQHHADPDQADQDLHRAGGRDRHRTQLPAQVRHRRGHRRLGRP